jgi:hypothetical protein
MSLRGETMVARFELGRFVRVTGVAFAAWLASETLVTAQQQSTTQNLKNGTTSSTTTTNKTTTTTRATAASKNSTNPNPSNGIVVNGSPAFVPSFSPGVYNWQAPTLPSFGANLGAAPGLYNWQTPTLPSFGGNAGGVPMLNGHGYLSTGSNVAWLGSNPNNPYNPYTNPNLSYVAGLYAQPYGGNLYAQPFGNNPLLNPFGGGVGYPAPGFPYGNPYMATGGYPLGYPMGNVYGNPGQPSPMGFAGNNLYGAGPGQFAGGFGSQPFGNYLPPGEVFGGWGNYVGPGLGYRGGFGY